MRWADKSFFYHIYPLGFCGAEKTNDFTQPVQSRLKKIQDWLPHIQKLGVNALYIGPLFESSAHGYDTADYFYVDRRIGTNEELKRLSQEIHKRGMRLVFDAVFNHVGRHFFAFRDVLQKKKKSVYCDWFCLDFSKDNHYGDGFCYEGWAGCDDIVKLNLAHAPVREYLFSVVSYWIREFFIDGLRLDAANCLSRQFIRELSSHCRNEKSDFWLMAEFVYGDYARLLMPQMCHSVTNYEAYQALHSGANQGNMAEIASALNRQFHKQNGVYCGQMLYNFLDNHDVSRIASVVREKQKLFPLYTLLFTIPGIPSVYYGSEWGVIGERSKGDEQVRNCLFLQDDNFLTKHIRRLAECRRRYPALIYGDFRILQISRDVLVFSRRWKKQEIMVAVNMSKKTRPFCCQGIAKALLPYGSELYVLKKYR